LLSRKGNLTMHTKEKSGFPIWKRKHKLVYTWTLAREISNDWALIVEKKKKGCQQGGRKGADISLIYLICEIRRFRGIGVARN